jgi:hypothetical protein
VAVPKIWRGAGLKTSHLHSQTTTPNCLPNLFLRLRNHHYHIPNLSGLFRIQQSSVSTSGDRYARKSPPHSAANGHSCLAYLIAHPLLSSSQKPSINLSPLNSHNGTFNDYLVCLKHRQRPQTRLHCLPRRKRRMVRVLCDSLHGYVKRWLA